MLFSLLKKLFSFLRYLNFCTSLFPAFSPRWSLINLQENLIKRISYRHSEDAYSLQKWKNDDCCGVVDNGCIHYGLHASISGQGECLDIVVIYTRNQFQTATYFWQIARNIANAFKKLFKKSDTLKVDYQKISKNLIDYRF